MRHEDLTRIEDGSPFPLHEPDSPAWRVRRLHDDSAIDDVPTDGLSDEPAGAWNYLGVSISARQLGIFFVCLVIGLVGLALRLAQLQLLEGDTYRSLAEGNRSRTEMVRAQRGIIYARDGTPLVHNVPNFSLYLTASRLPKGEPARRNLLLRLADIAQTGPADIEESLRKGHRDDDRPILVADKLTRDQAVLVAIVQSEYDAVTLDVGSRRDYADTDVPSLSHVLGYEGRIVDAELQAGGDYLPSDLIGKTGLEKQYEKTLRGKYGRKVIEVDAAGRVKNLIAEDPSDPGSNLTLTIDLDLQKVAEKFLKEELRAAGKSRGSVIVMRPDTGEILALVSAPDFDNNLFAKGISSPDLNRLFSDPDNPLFNRAIAASLPSGSVFKPVVAAAALEEGLVTPRTSVLSTGGIRVGQWFFPDWKTGGHGVTDVYKAIAESVNTYFYAVGGGWDKIAGLGLDRITAYARKFGLGAKLGIDLYGENTGFLPSRQWKEAVKGEKWFIGDTYHLAIGQGDLLVTPLQVAAFTATFANGGNLMRPRVVAAVASADGKRLEYGPETIAKQVVSAGTIDVVRHAMRQTVTAGSARSLSTLPVAAAAKTGTAQWHSNKPTHAWFTAFAPFDKPQLVVTVVIEEGGEGSVTAAPVAKNIFQWYFGGRHIITAPEPTVLPLKPAPSTVGPLPAAAAPDQDAVPAVPPTSPAAPPNPATP